MEEPLTVSWLTFFLISKTFLWEFECTDASKVGLAAGRYSGNRRPDLYRTPQALHRVLGPLGPSLHCGVSVTSQCVHFLRAIDSCNDDLFISMLLESWEILSFLGLFWALHNDLPARCLSDCCFWKGGMNGIEKSLSKLERRRRLPRGRFVGITGNSKL